MFCFVKVVEFWDKLLKQERSACKSYPPVFEAAQDPLAVAKLEFFIFFANQFQPFFVAYQTDNSVVPFLYQDLFKLFRKIIQLIIKQDLLRKCGSG